MTMKVHSYFREKVINGFNKDGYYATFIPEWAAKSGITRADLDQPIIEISGNLNTSLLLDFITEIKRYAFFFIVPTLVYRDEYVRTRSIRWNIVFKNALTFLFLIFYVWSIFKAMCIPLFKNTVEQPGGMR